MFTLCGRPGAYVHLVSGAPESRAAVFTSQPQAIEVFQAGAWWAGELLGWRHGGDGSCQVRVRVTLGGVAESAWMDLGALRLPERSPAVATEPAAPDGSATQKLPRASTAARREGPVAGSAVTATMPAVRDVAVGPTAKRSGGRRRAPEVPEPVAAPAALRSGGRRRAPDGPETVVAAASSAPRPGGRRRAPEDVDAPEQQIAEPAHAAGRHRAALPGDAGRHRRADTGLIPAVAESAPVGALPAPHRAGTRLDDTFGGRARPPRASAVTSAAESDLLTRPMRLSDHVPHARRPRVDGSLAEV